MVIHLISKYVLKIKYKNEEYKECKNILDSNYIQYSTDTIAAVGNSIITEVCLLNIKYFRLIVRKSFYNRSEIFV